MISAHYSRSTITCLVVAISLFLIPVSSFSHPSKPVDFAKAGREAARILGDLIRLDTTNPPGNEGIAADYLSRLFDREGILNQRLAKIEGRDNVIARYHGSGKKKPLLLYSHIDVVPSDAGWGQWSVPPFSGEVHDHTLYGRGAIDAKGLLVCHLMTLVLLKRQNVPLDRDILFLAAASEESGGGPGVGWLLENHRSAIDAAYALGEGGRVWQRADSIWSVWLQAGEKSAHNITVVALGKAGHASVPSRQNAAERLVRALTQILDYPFPEQANSLSSEFYRILEPFDSRFENFYPRYHAMCHNTISLTILESGVKSNVIPSFAKANLNLRLLPGEDLDETTRLLQDCIEVPGVTVSHAPNAESRSGIISIETPFYRSLEKSIGQVWPQAVIAPYLSPATSDASRLRQAGIQAYGLLPYPLTEEESATVHGVDERIRLNSLTQGVELMYHMVLDWAASKTSAEPKTIEHKGIQQ